MGANVPVFMHVPGNNTKISRETEKLRYLEGGDCELTRETDEIRTFRKKVTFEILSFSFEDFLIFEFNQVSCLAFSVFLKLKLT